jgi:hypothetical protein
MTSTTVAVWTVCDPDSVERGVEVGVGVGVGVGPGVVVEVAGDCVELESDAVGLINSISDLQLMSARTLALRTQPR